MAEFEITVDGEKAGATAGETVLQVCRRMSKDIPTLCHHDALEPYASCRVCLVELEGESDSKLVASCQYPVEPGMRVRTQSEAVLDARRLVLELLLARCPANVAVRDFAARYGVTETPYEKGDDQEDCILCGLCVRVCEDLLRASAVGFCQRGLDRTVGSPFDEPSETCIGCTACVNVCPTGKVRADYERALLRLPSWNTELELTVCSVCGERFAASALIEHMAEKRPDLAERIRVCPSCRARNCARDWSEAVKLIAAGG